MINGADKPKSIGYGTVQSPIEPGSSVDIKISPPWLPNQSGTVSIIGVVDDTDRIAELDETNNQSRPTAIEVK